MAPASSLSTSTATAGLARATATAVVGAGLLALASQVRVPLWSTGVPLKAQPQMVLLLAALLGRARAGLALATWLAAAAYGLPVLAGGGGPVALFGPTFGYLCSYGPAVALVGRFGRRPSLAAFVAWQAAGAGTLGLGALWLSLWVGPALAWRLGVEPFWLADLLKVSLAYLAYGALPARWRGVVAAR